MEVAKTMGGSAGRPGNDSNSTTTTQPLDVPSAKIPTPIRWLDLHMWDLMELSDSKPRKHEESNQGQRYKTYRSIPKDKVMFHDFTSLKMFKAFVLIFPSEPTWNSKSSCVLRVSPFTLIT
jgi:hypothetical protein